jgi:hypothetical protein
MSEQSNCISCVLIGDTGVGKSEFGNRYLGRQMFKASDSPNPVTLEPKSQPAVIDNLTRHVIDTEGYADGNSISSEQIQKLAAFLKTWKHGVNAICIVLNGQHDRFSQGTKDILRWIYNTFATPEVLDHICIVFTRCYDGISQPNRQLKRTEYMAHVQEFFKQVSGVKSVPEIPVFFVDSLNTGSADTQANMVQFHGWVVSRTALPTNKVRVVELRDQIEEQVQKRVFVNHVFEGPAKDMHRFAVYQDRKRQKVTPHNGDPVRYSEWTVIKSWKEAAGHQTIKEIRIPHEDEVKYVWHHGSHSMLGFSSHDHTHYDVNKVTWDEIWTETTGFDGLVIKTQPQRCNERSTLKWKGEEGGWTNGYTKRIR